MKALFAYEGACISVRLEEMRSGDDELESESLAFVHAAHYWPQPAVVSPSLGHEKYLSLFFPHTISLRLSWTSAGRSRRERLPSTFLYSCAFRSPVPGRLTQRFLLVNRSPFFIGVVVTTHAYAKLMMSRSPLSIVFLPPRASHTARVPIMSCFSSLGSMEMPMSGPFHALSDVKCFSMMDAPSATAASDVKLPSEWSLWPTIASGNAFLRSPSAPRRTSSYGVGYMEVQLRSANGTLCARSIRTLFPTERISFMPVDMMTGFLYRAMCSMSG